MLERSKAVHPFFAAHAFAQSCAEIEPLTIGHFPDCHSGPRQSPYPISIILTGVSGIWKKRLHFLRIQINIFLSCRVFIDILSPSIFDIQFQKNIILKFLTKNSENILVKLQKWWQQYDFYNPLPLEFSIKCISV